MSEQHNFQSDGMSAKMHDIVRHINELMDDYNQMLASLTNQRDSALRQAAEKLEATKRQIETDKKNNDTRLQANEAETAKLKTAAEIKNSAALAHFKQQSLNPEHSESLSPPQMKIKARALEEAKNQLEEVDRYLSLLTKTEKPKNLGSMIAAFSGVGFVISICAAVGANTGNGEGAFLLVNLLFSGLGITIAIIRHRSATGQMQEHYGRMLTELERANAYLNGFRDLSKENHHRVEVELDNQRQQAHTNYQRTVKEAENRYKDELQAYQRLINVKVKQAKIGCDEFYAETGFAGLHWHEQGWKEWGTANNPLLSSCIGYLESPLFDFKVPAMLSFNDQKGGRCLLLKATGERKDEANMAIQSIMVRLLANVPPGKVLFTLVDPVGLGQNVAPFMPLADFEEKLITSRAWTEPSHIEEQLSKLTEHMENVIQKYLRNDYATIEEYNQKAGEVAEPYRVLVVMDFPVNFNESSARRLVSIARNGPRCGVYTLVIMDDDASKKLPYGFNVGDLEQAANVIHFNSGRFVWADQEIQRYSVALDKPPVPELFSHIIKTVGEKSKEAMKVEVPFDKLLSYAKISADKLWESNTQDMIHVPLGPKGAQKLQYLTFGKGTEHHAVVIGMPGSGKSNLMHIIITSMAMMYSPQEIQLYLIDFKQGVEFKRYAQARLPHAKVIAIESEREFGLSVLKGLDEELYKRGEMFRKLGVNAISEYRKNFPDEKLPRILLLVDEFQEFFSYDDNIGREANLLLDRLIRQGRYAGIHVMLGSQSLANRSSLPSSTLGQIGIRIALKCSESDAKQIMADDNPQARLLSRPGEAIYNAASGLIEGNNFFQVALFTDEDRQARLDGISEFASKVEADNSKPFERPIIFEGNEPSRLEECATLKELLSQNDYPAPKRVKELWLGEPVAIRPPTSARLRQQGASNLLIVTRNEEEGIGMLAAAIISLAGQVHPANAKFFIVDLTSADSAWENLAEDLAEALPHDIEVLGKRDMTGTLNDLVELIDSRISNEEKGEDIYFVIQGLHRARDLREEEGRGRNIFDREAKGPSAPELFSKLLREGPECGVYVLAWCDAYANVKRTLGRGLNEFALRVAGAMSNDDSMGLLDDSAASKLDKPHRAIFFDDERPGHLEKFRPYAIPDKNWLEQTAQALHARNGKYQTSTGD